MSYLGSHLPLSGPDKYLATAKLALSFKENAFMFYVGAPQNTIRTPLENMKIEAGRAYLKEHGFDESKIVVHAPYIVNLANNDDPDKFAHAKRFIVEEMRRTAAFGVKWMVLHPGAHKDKSVEEATAILSAALSEIVEQGDPSVTICLETMAGKGSEVGVGFEWFALFLKTFPYPGRIGVCLDTCHIHDAGYDLSDVTALLDEFDRVIGLDKLKVVHLNDSKNPRGAHKDRHENIGFGFIGFDALHAFTVEPRLENIPIILETPYVGEVPPYEKEIEMLRNGTFDPDLKSKLAELVD